MKIFVFLWFNLTILIVLSKHLIPIDSKILEKLRILPDRQALLDHYDEFESNQDYRCAIECLKARQDCNSYSFDILTSICKLFNDPNKVIDPSILRLRDQFQELPCDRIKCRPGAICINDENPQCVCLNGATTPDDCDKIEQGTWTEFRDWNRCSVTCGEGFQLRERDCVSLQNPSQKMSDEYCIGTRVEIKACHIATCPTYGPWSPWTPCSTFCGIGVKQRNRSCIPPESNCGNYTFEQRACGEANCQRVVGIKETEPEKYPFKGYLAIREGDILCVTRNSSTSAKHMADLICKSMGLIRGAQYAILNPLKEDATCYPGIMCDGNEKSFYDCKYDPSQTSIFKKDLFAIITRCIVDGDFSPWSEWSKCSKSCGTGQKVRFRTCTEPSPSILEVETGSTDLTLAGKNCSGDYKQIQPCNKRKC